ncbi:hypothetical protein llg_03990 [Luteolibacter sp. LG18]|nr:hypothetical protein llg_03990 [Luteolibacter sp. LG18]
MDMVWHDAPFQEPVTLGVVMEQGVLDNFGGFALKQTGSVPGIFIACDPFPEDFFRGEAGLGSRVSRLAWLLVFRSFASLLFQSEPGRSRSQ